MFKLVSHLKTIEVYFSSKHLLTMIFFCFYRSLSLLFWPSPLPSQVWSVQPLTRHHWPMPHQLMLQLHSPPHTVTHTPLQSLNHMPHHWLTQHQQSTRTQHQLSTLPHWLTPHQLWNHTPHLHWLTQATQATLPHWLTPATLTDGNFSDTST